MAEGLKSFTGVASPPFSNGPYEWDQHVTFTAGVSGAIVSGNVWFVNGVSGNNGNNGKSWTNAFATIGQAVSSAGTTGDIVYVAPGSYDETVTVNKAKLTFVGVGGRGAVFVEPSAAGAEGMQVTADDVTLVNIGVDGDDTADYALNVNAASRFRAYGCKFESGSGSGVVVLLDGTATDQVGDALFEDCEFAWGGTGIQFKDSAYGYPTQIFVRGCRFHNLSAAHLAESTNGAVANLQVTDCVHDASEAGVAPTDWINVDSAN